MTPTRPGGADPASAGPARPPVPGPGTLWVGTSWKMNKTLAEAAAFVDALAAAEVPPGLVPFVLPAHTALAHVRDRLPAGSPVLLGRRTPTGARGRRTGEISMRMAADAGAQLVEMGHSERRASFGETDDTVALKAAAALDHGLLPLVCVGEPLRSATPGARPIRRRPGAGGPARVAPADVGRVLVAYEPIWAIGEHGRPATQDQIAPVMALIADVVAEAADGGGALALLYGGGVHPDNAEELLTDPCTDGLFVGRAGWDVQGYLRLLDLCAPYARPAS